MMKAANNPITTFGIFGEVLFDCFADGLKVLGGAPFNVAWHLQAFGALPRFISRVGDDDSGREIRQAMRLWGMHTADLQTDRRHPTGAVAVELDRGEPRYRILDNQAYDFISQDELEDFACRVLYHGSLALRHPLSRAALTAMKSAHQGLVFMDVNLREPWWDQESLSAWMAEADWVKMNEQELALLAGGVDSLEVNMQRLIQQYQLQGLVITCGGEGAVAIAGDAEAVRVRPEQDLPIADTVGAGDAFAAVLLIGVSRNWPLALSMQRAQSFASAIVGRRGAIVRDLEFYRSFVREWGL